MPTFTLEELQTEAEQKYEPLKIPVAGGEEIVLQSILLLSKEKRNEYKTQAKAINAAQEAGEDIDEQAVLIDLLALVAADPRLVREHLADQNLGVLKAILDRYQEAAQLGEASGSPS